MLEYQGFYAAVEYDDKAECYRGEVVHPPLSDRLYFISDPQDGQTVHAAFVDAVDMYIDFLRLDSRRPKRWDYLRKVS